ncbi:ABC transporter substrate-binding protein [Methylobacterium symbioticum]|uniref:Thiamine pyrimidine synthase n=1 Tax=Methylobacterium symbioticum TaxID=2584084 RepID=A0A509EA84_9HYPH|nr:ABC transporter substrate-binding protein [Methylobacterium symbioticum]VUD71186.1 Formylaminopyrimidine-binding protein [Methylobacterium symbioticum]
MLRRFLAAVLASAILTASVPAARAETKLRFALDWIPGSTHAAFLIAQQKGYYKAEGLDVTIDPGKGSTEVVRQLAAGLYDMGFPDINVLMEFNARNPDQAFRAVMSGYEQAPAAIVFLRKSGISEPAQLAGRKLGSAPHDSTFKLFPVFAKRNGFDPDSVKVQSIEPSLREVLLARGDVDAVPGQVFNSYIALKAKGVKAEDIQYFMYSDHGLSLYANSIAVSRRFAEQHPEAVRAFLRASVKGLRDLVRDPEEGVRAALTFQPLLNAEVERERLAIAMKCCLVTERVLKDGWGVLDEDRLAKGIALIVQSYGLPRSPAVAEVYDPSFLPSRDERMVR